MTRYGQLVQREVRATVRAHFPLTLRSGWVYQGAMRCHER
jgi:hypothetical protein